MKKTLIVGGGFAGIAMAWELEKRHLPYKIIDPFSQRSSSFISAGLINPVTGRKYQLQWNIRNLLPLIENEMHQLEQFLNCRLLIKNDILKIHKSEQALEAWQLQKSNPELKEFITDPAPADRWSRFIDARYGAITIHHAMRIDSGALISNFLRAIGDKWIAATVDHDAIKISTSSVEYRDEQFDYVIFCEGIGALQNPLFHHIPFKPSKGECMVIDIPLLKYSGMIHKGVILVPLENNRWWVGATSSWNDLEELPTEAGIGQLHNDLHSLLRVPYQVLEEKAAIRPTIRDRTPVVGNHPVHQHLFILNGMGTKGASLSNYYAGMLANHMFENGALDMASDVQRFSHLLQ